MFKLFALFALVAVASAKPGFLETHHEYELAPVVHKTVVHEPITTIVKSIPTAISHQSHTQIHSDAHLIKTISAPVIHAPLIHHAPVIHTIHAAPLLHSIHSDTILGLHHH